ncbi:aldo/keto reductase [candidate division KSB1 bacterium]|nr:aldo/keto reductase [candidate division KSB1 bacterium]
MIKDIFNDKRRKDSITRRRFLKTSSAVVGLSMAPYINCGGNQVGEPMKRPFGRLGFEVTTLGLGGQASIQWTPADVDPVKIILKAFHLGVNYFDTSNVYGPSQMNYGKAFRELDLIPGDIGYDEPRRESFFLTSKTHLRWAKGGYPVEGVRNSTNGNQGSKAIDDLKRSLSLMFGDGQGNYPAGAYLDMILLHNLTSMAEIDVLYEGLESPDPKAEHIGALVALKDYRDGTNLTGLNPKEEKLVRHLGFSGHYSAPVMMEMIQRDKHNLLEGMLVAINANDRLNLSMQNNVIPIAAAKKMGIIAMKVFADGAMYSKDAHWSSEPSHVVRTVGSPDLPSRPLIEYSLSTPGIHTAIIGIGQINEKPQNCQLQQNLSSAQIVAESLSATERKTIEDIAAVVKDGKTNYFQMPEGKLTPPRNPAVDQQMQGSERVVRLSWHTAYAGSEPIKHYEIWRDNQKITQVDHHPQLSKVPFVYEEKLTNRKAHIYKLQSVDMAGTRAQTDQLLLKAI